MNNLGYNYSGAILGLDMVCGVLVQMLLDLMLIDVLSPVFLDKAIKGDARNSSEDFLRLCVIGRLAVLLTVIVVHLGSLKSSSASDQLVRELGLVFSLVVLVVGFGVVVVVVEKTHFRGDSIKVIWYAGFGGDITCLLYSKPTLIFLRFPQRGLGFLTSAVPPVIDVP